MGLYINSDKHPDVFINKGQIIETNQRVFIGNHLSELLDEQQKANETLQQSFDQLKGLMEEQSKQQASQWKNFGNRLYELKKGNLQQKKAESHVMEWLKKLDDKNAKLQVTLENEQVIKQEFLETVTNLSQSNQEVALRLDKVGLLNEQLELKVNEQLDLQKQISQQISKQDETQREVLDRLENQEALTEKILRQIDHFRSVLFERTNYLAEKIESGYNFTSSYFTKLVTGNEKPLTQFLMEKKQKDDQKTIE